LQAGPAKAVVHLIAKAAAKVIPAAVLKPDVIHFMFLPAQEFECAGQSPFQFSDFLHKNL
jgi:hypothetical protein